MLVNLSCLRYCVGLYLQVLLEEPERLAIRALQVVQDHQVHKEQLDHKVPLVLQVSKDLLELSALPDLQEPRVGRDLQDQQVKGIRVSLYKIVDCCIFGAPFNLHKFSIAYSLHFFEIPLSVNIN